MRSPKWIVAGLLIVLVGTVPLGSPLARAADVETPTLLVRVKSINDLIADAKYLAGLAGQEEAARQMEAMIPSFLGPKGLGETGLDTTRPLGLYGILKPEVPASPVVLLVPVADEKAFVESLHKLTNFPPLANVAIKIERGGDGVYTVSFPNPVGLEGYFTIADGYAYMTAGLKDTAKKSIVAANRLDAGKLLPNDHKTWLGITVRLDTIDPTFKQIALGQIELQAAAAKERPARGDEPRELRNALIDYFVRQVRSLLTDGRAVEFQYVLDRTSDEISAQLSLTAKPGSPLAEQIAAAANRPSRFGPLSDAAGQGALNVAVPEQLRSTLMSAVQEGFKKQQAGQKDAVKRDLAQKVFDALSPTLQAGELDLFVGLLGPNPAGKFTVAGGIKLKDAGRVEQLVRDLLKSIPDPKARESVHLDAEAVGEVKVHKIVPPERDAEMQRIFGDDATGVFAFPPDAQVAAFGADAADLLKQILGTAGKSDGPFRAEGRVGRLALLDKNDGPRAKKAAAAAFATDPKAEVVHVAVEGGSSLRARVWMKTTIIKFAVKMDEAKKQENR